MGTRVSEPRAADGTLCVPCAECSRAAAAVVCARLVVCGWRSSTDGDDLNSTSFLVGCNNWLASSAADRMGRCRQDLVLGELMMRSECDTDPVKHIRDRMLQWVPDACAVAMPDSEEWVALDVSMLIRRALEVAALISMARDSEASLNEPDVVEHAALVQAYTQMVALQGEICGADVQLYTCWCVPLRVFDASLCVCLRPLFLVPLYPSFSRCVSLSVFSLFPCPQPFPVSPAFSLSSSHRSRSLSPSLSFSLNMDMCVSPCLSLYI
jgi:hypothetical protein